MEDKIIKKTLEISNICHELWEYWVEYVKQRGEIELIGSPEITMWDGGSERMDKLIYSDNDVWLVDCYGHHFSLANDAGPMTYQELCDVVFG